MKFYLAPMEGITGYIFRNAYHHFFYPMDKYFTPFISPSQKRCFKTREKNDILPEHNNEIFLVPQILTNKAEDFIWTSKKLKEFGYQEVNLNLGCPSNTVVSKKKGAGFLSDLETLRGFLDRIFEAPITKISIKTRIGVNSSEEWNDLIEIFNKYPLEELIIHPRIQKDFYQNKPNLEIIQNALLTSKNPICYNGDIFCVSDMMKLKSFFPKLERVMIGRGMLFQPDLLNQILEESMMSKEVIYNFHEELCREYQKVLSGQRDVLFKMKELWNYMAQGFEDHEKYAKRIRKADHLCTLRKDVELLLKECERKSAKSTA